MFEPVSDEDRDYERMFCSVLPDPAVISVFGLVFSTFLYTLKSKTLQFRVNVGGVNINDPDCNVTVGVMLRVTFFSGLLHAQYLHEEETIVFEAHGMSFPCTELLLFNYAKVYFRF